LYDCLRANKSTSAWGLEARVPFLDKDFMSVAMAIDPAEKMVPKFSLSMEFLLLDFLSMPEQLAWKSHRALELDCQKPTFCWKFLLSSTWKDLTESFKC
jgi:asparagine synthetase B (glutamine-hydrolysing)